MLRIFTITWIIIFLLLISWCAFSQGKKIKYPTANSVISRIAANGDTIILLFMPNGWQDSIGRRKVLDSISTITEGVGIGTEILTYTKDYGKKYFVITKDSLRFNKAK